MITLATLPKATAQEVFNQAAKHLLQQNKKSGRANIACAYRGEDGAKCAAGCFISDEEYVKKNFSLYEDRSWQGLVLKKKVPYDHQMLIGKLQQVHDHSQPNEWPEYLQALAEKFKLTFNLAELLKP